MQGKVHVAIGTATLLCMCVKYPAGVEMFGVNILPEIALLTAAAGSYAPDVDNPRTHSGMKHKVTSKVVSKVGGGHRGITHTLLVPAIVAAIMYGTSYSLGVYQNISTLLMSLLFGFEMGWCMHIFADLFNGKGCPVLWPFTKKKIHIMDLPSSGIGAWIFAVIFITIMVLITCGGMLG